ncbi:MAG: bifunctional phosphopantothenoylcysteine decarboxylase/phosphopantothenate--cysteine ligase CoaBC [Muribaculaceae bacterium]|nr:bifunctional phosphopantothenoylcysteine decarboxylase/phosphopantothenate--cysteine ligase CoaBC [Muribaculaceae bacterium]
MNTPTSLKDKKIVLGISGGIAVYKTVMLLRLLQKAGAEVQVVMTPNAKEFVTPVTFSSLSGKPVVSEFFTANSGEWHSHVDLGLWADLMLIAPATASTMAKMANGVADNMLITTYLSAKEPVMIAPAMDLDMWKHPSTQRNLEILKKDGVMIVEPQSGYLASGLTGKGRMAEPEDILKSVEEYFSRSQSLKGKRVLVTAGPTYENIDPVRFIGNYSSGRMGFEIASELGKRGAEVVLVAGPVNLDFNLGDNIKRIDVCSAKEMYEVSRKEFPEVDFAIFSAAVADYAPEEYSDSKIKRENLSNLTIKLKRNPDIAAELGKIKTRQKTIGFALETDNEIENAKKKLIKKNFDWVVLNSMNDPEAGFMKDTNKITMISSEGEVLPFAAKSKKEVACDIIEFLERYNTNE